MSSASTFRTLVHLRARSWRGCVLPLRSTILTTLSCALLLFASHAHAVEWPYGVFSLTPPNRPVNAAILANPSVAGVSIRGNWQYVELTEGVYDWSYFDKQIARAESAGKKILLRITAGGKNTPQWVLDAGVQTFSFVDPKSKQTITIPVFWDLIFLEKKKNFIAAMGQHFASNPNVILVSTSCANATTDDWSVPHATSDVQNWLAVGYTSAKLISACQDIIDATMAAFPNQWPLIAVSQNGKKLDPYPDYVARHVVEYARGAYLGRFIAQKNSLAADTPDPSALPILGAWQIIYDNQPNVAGQMLWYVTNDASCRMNGGVKPCDPVEVLHEAVTIGALYGMRYQEIYQQDILNPELAGVINYAAELLAP